MAFITTTANSISSGGTINGSITIEGDLTVNGDGAGAYDEIIDGNLRISSTNKLEFGDDGTYIHQSADGTLDLVSDTILELNGGAGSMKIDANSKISLSNNDLGTNNTLFGKSAGASIVSGANDNVLIGPEAGDAITIGDDNIAVGNGALGAETVGQSSVAIGTAAAGNQAKSGGSQGHMRNTAIGTTALYYNVTGTNNTFLGADAGVGVSGNSHTNNTGLGYLAMSGITTGDYNVAIGSGAGVGITAHDNNIAIGQDSLRVCGNELNIAIGVYALEDGSNGYSNIAIGGYSLKAHATNNTVAVGESALQKNTSGIQNTALGYQTLVENTVADNNTAVGFQALKLSNKTGSVGIDSNNTAVGSLSSSQITTGVQNTSLGSFALGQTVDSDSNTALGYYACGAGDVSAGGVTAVGAYALAENINGEKNTSVGFQAGNVITTGDNNTIIGYDADTDDNAAVNQTVIGCETTGVADNSVTLGNASVTAVYMAQDSGAMVHSAGLTTSGAVLTQGMSDNTDRFVVTDDGSSYKGGFTKKSGSMGGLFVRGSSSKIGILTNSSYAANPSGDTEAFMVSSADATATFSGKVGIGRTDPQFKLDVYEDSSSTGVAIGKYAAGKTVGVLATSADTSGYFYIQSYLNQGTTFGDIVLNSSGGNVGIGLTDPAYKLEVKSSVTGNWISRIYNTADTSNPNGLLVRVDDPNSTGMILGVHNGDGYRTKFGTSITESANIIDITDTTDASDDSGDTGALRVEGGASIAKKLYVGGATSLEGGLDVSSTTTLKYETNVMTLTRDGGHLMVLQNNGSAIADGEALGYYRFNGKVGGNDEEVGVDIRAEADGAWTADTDCPARLKISTNSGSGTAERMRIDKDGVVTLGVNDATATSVGIGASPSVVSNTSILHIGNHNTAVAVIYLTDNEAQDDFFIQSNSELRIGYNNTTYHSMGTTGIAKWTSNTNSNLSIDTASATSEPRIIAVNDADNAYVTLGLYAEPLELKRGQIKFPATQVASSDANTLDDYEEGTWSPVICQSDDISDVLPMHAETAGNYTKIGNIVHVTGQAIGNSSSGDMLAADSIAIKGLPFAVPNAYKNRSTATLIGLTVNLASGKRIGGYVAQNSSQINLYVNDGTSEGALRFDEFTNAGHVVFQATYLV